MNRRQALGLGATLFLTACSKGYYKKLLQEFYEQGKTEEARAIEKIVQSYVFIDTKVKYKTQSEELETRRKGIGIVVEDYILTLYHIVSIDSIIEHTPFGISSVEINKISEENYIDGKVLEAVAKNRDLDLTVFKVPKGYSGERFPYGLGNSDLLEYGQEILLIGNPKLEGTNVREGIVAAKPSGEYFITSAFITFGDSGTATVDRKTFELLGLNANRVYDELALVRSINKYKPYLK